MSLVTCHLSLVTCHLSLIGITFQLVPVHGQSPSNSTPPVTQVQLPSQDEEDVVRITTNLIQIDAVVTDKNGKQVTDLRADEFEIQENGAEQKITNFSYVPLASVASTQNAPTIPVDKKGPSPPPLTPIILRPEQVRRTIALVIDDLGLSAQSIFYVRRALTKFIDEQMQPGDFVAILYTSGVQGILQQFTTDKQQLRVAVDRVRWNPLGRAGVNPFPPLGQDDIALGTAEELPQTRGEGNANITIEEFRSSLFTVGTLSTLKQIVQGLKDFPGRKSVMLFSDGIKIVDSDGQNSRILNELRRVTDIASRSSVVFYTMDARGNPWLELTSEDKMRNLQTPVRGKGARTRGLLTNPLETSLLNRRMEFLDSQEGLNYLAEETGGLAIRHSNDLSTGLKKMLDDQQGYYLIGYHPNEETFDPKRVRFNKIKIKVKRSGLKVRYRSGFLGFADNETDPVTPLTRAQQLSRAINAPFANGGLDVQLTLLFGNDAESGSFVRSLLHVDAGKLTFTEEPDGMRKLVFDIMAVTFGESGAVVDQVSRTETVRVRNEDHRFILENGFDYIITVPIKKPGAYQLRIALRDSATERIGSASQFIEVPDLSTNRLVLSGIVVNGFDAAKLKNETDRPNASDITLTADPRTGPGVRRFRRGEVLQYEYVIYNAALNKTDQRPQLQTQMRLFRDGRHVYTGSSLAFDLGSQTDFKRLKAGGRFKLETETSLGDYVLQIIVTDLLAKDKHRTTTKWVDFVVSDK